MSADLIASRGVKRKLEDEEDGCLDGEEGSRRCPAKQAELQSSPPFSEPPPVPVPPPPPPASPPNNSGSSNLQRQHIFNSSLCKLSRSRQSSDPSLLRSVLICNTLRMLEKELEGAGFKISFGPNGVSFISPVPPTQEEMLDLMPPTFQSVPPQPSPPPPPPPSTSTLPPPPPAPPCSPSPFVDSSIAFSPSAPVPTTGAAESAPDSAAALQPYPGQLPPTVVPTTTTVCGDSYADGGSGDGSFDYDKYFLDSTTLPSGRATPFLRNYTDAGDGGEEDGEVEVLPLQQTQYSSCEGAESCPAVTAASDACNPMLTITCTAAAAVAPATTMSISSGSSPPTIQSTTNSLSPSPSSSTSSSSSSTTFSLLSSSSSSSSSPYLLPSYVSFSSGSDEIFGDIDLSLYDFDIFSPLSPPSSTSKTTIPLMSAEELMREVNGISLANSLGNSANASSFSSSASLSSSSSASSSCSSSSSSSSSSLLSIGHDPNSVAFSGQISFITSSYCASSSPSSLMSNVINGATTTTTLGSSSSATSSSSSQPLSPSSSSSSSAPCPAGAATTQPTAQPANCASSASGAPAPLHLHSASAR